MTKPKKNDIKTAIHLFPDYKTNLIKFITETRSKKATPVLITPVTRMRFDKEGNIEETHKEYSAAVWEVGNEYKNA